MDRVTALQEIRDLQESGQSRQIIVRVLESEGVSKTSAYRWINEANNLNAEGQTPRDLAIQATIAILNKATVTENFDVALKAAATLAKLA